MRYEIDPGNRLRQVAIGRAGDSLAVTVDGRPYHVDVARIDAHTLSLVVDSGPSRVQDARSDLRGSSPPSGPGGGRVYDITLVPEVGGGWLMVRSGAAPIRVVPGGRRVRPRPEESRPHGAGPQRITAPMPGKIVRVMVGAGDSVRRHQPVVVVEAMKMENELRADRDGTVAEVHVRDGVPVEAGALLVVIQ